MFWNKKKPKSKPQIKTTVPKTFKAKEPPPKWQPTFGETKKKDEKREKRVGKDVFDNLVCGKCGAPFYRRTLQARATHFEDDRCLDACRSELFGTGQFAG